MKRTKNKAVWTWTAHLARSGHISVRGRGTPITLAVPGAACLVAPTAGQHGLLSKATCVQALGGRESPGLKPDNVTSNPDSGTGSRRHGRPRPRLLLQ